MSSIIVVGPKQDLTPDQEVYLTHVLSRSMITDIITVSSHGVSRAAIAYADYLNIQTRLYNASTVEAMFHYAHHSTKVLGFTTKPLEQDGHTSALLQQASAKSLTTHHYRLDTWQQSY